MLSGSLAYLVVLVQPSWCSPVPACGGWNNKRVIFLLVLCSLFDFALLHISASGWDSGKNWVLLVPMREGEAERQTDRQTDRAREREREKNGAAEMVVTTTGVTHHPVSAGSSLKIARISST